MDFLLYIAKKNVSVNLVLKSIDFDRFGLHIEIKTHGKIVFIIINIILLLMTSYFVHFCRKRKKKPNPFLYFKKKSIGSSIHVKLFCHQNLKNYTFSTKSRSVWHSWQMYQWENRYVFVLTRFELSPKKKPVTEMNFNKNNKRKWMKTERKKKQQQLSQKCIQWETSVSDFCFFLFKSVYNTITFDC